MKILYVLGFLPTYVKREIESLSEAGNEIIAVLPSRESNDRTAALWESITKEGGRGKADFLRVMPFHLFLGSPLKLLKPWAVSLRHPGFMCRSIPEGEFRYFLAASETLKKLPEGWIPDVIHAHFAGDQAHIARIMSGITGVPYSLTTHATDIFTPRNPARLKRVLRDASAVLTISDYNRKFLRDAGLFTGDVTVVKLGMDTENLPARTTVHSSPEGVCIASGLVEKKGVEVLLKAAGILSEKYPDLSFRVIGSDPAARLLEKYRSEARELPVEFTGALSSEMALAAVADATFFVLPCIQAANGDRDGIPVALMEAMGMGVPAVSTGISGIPELIDHGRNGLLADPGSPESLAEMIGRLLDYPEEAEAMGIRGRNSVLALHSPGDSAEAVLGVFSELTREGGKPE